MEIQSEINATTDVSPVDEIQHTVLMPASDDDVELTTVVTKVVVSEVIDEAMEIVESGISAGDAYNATHSEENLQLARVASQPALKDAIAAEKEQRNADNPGGVLMVAADLVARACDRGILFAGQVCSEMEQHWAEMAEREEAAATLIMLHNQPGASETSQRVVAASAAVIVAAHVSADLLDCVGSGLLTPMPAAGQSSQIEFEEAVQSFMSRPYIPRKSKIPYRSLPLAKPPSVKAPIEIMMPGDVTPAPGYDENYMEIEPPAVPHSPEVLRLRSRNVQRNSPGASEEVAGSFEDADSAVDPLDFNMSFLSVSESGDVSPNDEEFYSLSPCDSPQPGCSGDDPKACQEDEEDSD